MTEDIPHPEGLQNLAPVWTRTGMLIASHAAGSYIYDQNNTPYLDFTCGIGVANTGHCHPLVVEAIREQAGKLIHGQLNVVINQPVLNLVEALKDVLPAELDGFFFSNSGAEAVEGAIKLARQVTKKTNVIVFQGSFHGRTIGTMSLTTSKAGYRAGYQPLMAGVSVAPYPYAYRYGWDEEETSAWCLNELAYILRSQTSPSETAAVIVEPVLGEGGYVVPPASFLQGLRRICDENDILLIADEIQTGFGRTGDWFGFMRSEILPDIMVVSKGLASGMPISSVISRQELMSKWIPGSHGGTFGGNAVAAAAGAATIKAISSENMLENARERGMELLDGLSEIQSLHPVIGNVRGLGVMIGVEFSKENRQPNSGIVKKVLQSAYEKNLLLLSCGTDSNVIRFIPPLNVSKNEVEQALNTFEKSVRESL